MSGTTRPTATTTSLAVVSSPPAVVQLDRGLRGGAHEGNTHTQPEQDEPRQQRARTSNPGVPSICLVPDTASGTAFTYLQCGHSAESG